MLEQMRQQSRSLLIYLLFSIVIVVFIVNFGPQSHRRLWHANATPGDRKCRASGRPHLTSRIGRTPTPSSMAASSLSQQAKQIRLKETIMDLLIDRELLAGEAARLGFTWARMRSRT